jgi:hypothetical protein
MEKGNSKNTWIWVVVIVLVVIGVVVAIKMSNSGSTNSSSYMTDTQASTTTPDAVQATEDVSAGSVDAPTTSNGTAVTISYADALVKYQNDRIQLAAGMTCAATPIDMTFTNGTTIMLDNRSPDPRTVKIGTDYTVKGYGFKIIKLSSATLPATWLVDCDGQQNVATILLQK